METIKTRLSVLETKQEHIERHNVQRDKKIDDMYEVIMKLRGAKWVGWFIAAAFGFVLSNMSTLWQLIQHGKH